MKKITIIGGDNRLKTVKEKLIEQGYTVDTIGLYNEDNGDIKSSQIILLPVPTSKDKINVFAPLSDKKISLSEIEEKISSEQLVLTCNFSFENKRCFDYGSLDSYALLNAVPTAEGAIKIAIENTPTTIWKSKILIIGYGRVGKVLADRLKALGAFVTVSARKNSDFAMLDLLGFNYINTERLDLEDLNYDIIFNTVDVKVLSEAALKKSKCQLLVDLSTLGGFNMEIAKDMGKNAIKAPGLPGIIAPETAAEILSSTITHIINSYN